MTSKSQRRANTKSFSPCRLLLIIFISPRSCFTKESRLVTDRSFVYFFNKKREPITDIECDTTILNLPKRRWSYSLVYLHLLNGLGALSQSRLNKIIKKSVDQCVQLFKHSTAIRLNLLVHYALIQCSSKCIWFNNCNWEKLGEHRKKKEKKCFCFDSIHVDSPSYEMKMQCPVFVHVSWERGTFLTQLFSLLERLRVVFSRICVFCQVWAPARSPPPPLRIFRVFSFG